MASRGRVALIALGVGAAVLVVFVVTIWLLIAVTDDGLPGGAKVAVVEVEGIIGGDAARGLDTDGVIRVLGEYRDDPAVRAVVLRINSPGGVVAPTQEIFTAVRRLREAKKPVVASLGSVAASGGYYVAVAADRIYASPGTLTGSIGVVMQLANLEGLLKKVGVEYVVVKAGAYKDVGNMARAMTPEERRILQSLLDDVYDQFISAVAEGRGLDPQAVRAFAEGRIYSGRQAQSLKMVDDLGGLEDAIEAAAKMAGLPAKPKVIYPRRRFSLRELLRNELGLGPVSRILPSLETLRTPLYLMP
ncbi:MAG TPA: signal peptide peptidase SppA [Candidatus Dormibacteraeota bacterium]|nr:signal peptide peptidase SppA [Candidatus Dormibacteraeota bacterium]